MSSPSQSEYTGIAECEVFSIHPVGSGRRNVHYRNRGNNQSATVTFIDRQPNGTVIAKVIEGPCKGEKIEIYRRAGDGKTMINFSPAKRPELSIV